MTTVVALLALLATAAPAMATTTEQYIGFVDVGGFASYASTSAHTGVDNSHKDGPGNICPAVAAGYAGYTGNPNSGGNFTAGSNCGTGDRIWHPSGTSCCTFHGAVWGNGPGSQTTYYGRYTW
jgi:hypothetical protein